LEDRAYGVKGRPELSNKWMEYGRVLKRVTDWYPACYLGVGMGPHFGF